MNSLETPVNCSNESKILQASKRKAGSYILTSIKAAVDSPGPKGGGEGGGGEGGGGEGGGGEGGGGEGGGLGGRGGGGNEGGILGGGGNGGLFGGLGGGGNGDGIKTDTSCNTPTGTNVEPSNVILLKNNSTTCNSKLLDKSFTNTDKSNEGVGGEDGGKKGGWFADKRRPLDTQHPVQSHPDPGIEFRKPSVTLQSSFRKE